MDNSLPAVTPQAQPPYSNRRKRPLRNYPPRPILSKPSCAVLSPRGKKRRIIARRLTKLRPSSKGCARRSTCSPTAQRWRSRPTRWRGRSRSRLPRRARRMPRSINQARDQIDKAAGRIEHLAGVTVVTSWHYRACHAGKLTFARTDGSVDAGPRVMGGQGAPASHGRAGTLANRPALQRTRAGQSRRHRRMP